MQYTELLSKATDLLKASPDNYKEASQLVAKIPPEAYNGLRDINPDFEFRAAYSKYIQQKKETFIELGEVDIRVILTLINKAVSTYSHDVEEADSLFRLIIKKSEPLLEYLSKEESYIDKAYLKKLNDLTNGIQLLMTVRTLAVELKKINELVANSNQ